MRAYLRVAGILIKAVEADDRIAALTRQITDLNAKPASERLNRAKGVNALSIYGFDSAHPKLWDAVREVIGTERYSAAIDIAKGRVTIQQQIPLPIIIENKTPTLLTGGGAHNTINTVKHSPIVKISDAILAFLKDRGEEGAKIAAIKEHLSKAYGLETHEKTPGMTLYRLSMEKDAKVRRDGRTWCFVKPSIEGETLNPGDDTPGNDNFEQRKETTE